MVSQYDEDVYTYNNGDGQNPFSTRFFCRSISWYTNGRIANKRCRDLTHEYMIKKEFSTLLYQRSYGFNRGIKNSTRKSYNWTGRTRKYEDGDLYRIDADFGRDYVSHTIARPSRLVLREWLTKTTFSSEFNQTSLYDVKKPISTIDAILIRIWLLPCKIKANRYQCQMVFSMVPNWDQSDRSLVQSSQHNSFRQKYWAKKDQFPTEWTKRS